MKQRLNDADNRNLRYQCRMGYIIPGLLLIITNMILFLIVYENSLSYRNISIQITVIVLFLLCFLLAFTMNRKYVQDIINKEKFLEIKIIQSKEATKDFEAGSATLYIGQEMNEFIRYDLIIDYTRYRIEKELFDKCKNGDEVVFFIAPKSKFLLDINIRENLSF